MNKLPDGWQVKTIKEVCNIYTGNSINKHEKEKKFIGLKEGLNYIGTKDINFDNIIDYDNGVKIPFKDLKDFKIAKSNSTLLCIEGGSAGRKIGFTNQDICFGNKLCCFEAIEDAPKFIYYYLQSNYFLEEFYSNMQGLIGGVTKGNLKKIKIPIPQLDEQKRIASALSKIDAYLENTIKLIEEKERFKKGIAKKLLTCKEGENIPEARFKEFNDEWDTVMLGNILSYEQPQNYIVKSEEYDNKNKYPVLTAGKTFILGYTNEEFGIYDKLPVIIFDDFTTDARYVDFPFKVKSSAIKILKSKCYNTKLIYELMKNIKFNARTHKRYYLSEYQYLKIKIPKSIKEQEDIGKFLSLLDAEIDNLKKQEELIKKMKKGMINKLMSGEVRL